MKHSNGKKRNVLMMALICLLAVIAAYFILKVIIAKTTAAKEASQTEALEIIELDDIKRISYSDGENTLSFTLTDSVWVCDEYAQYPIDQDILTQLVGTAAHLSAEKVITDFNELSQYGFGDGQTAVTLTGADGSEYTLCIGDMTGTSYYLRRGDTDDKIFTVGSELPNSLSYDIYTFIAYEKIPNFNADNVYAVRLSYQNDSYSFAKTTEDSADAVSDEDTADSTAETVWIVAKNDEPYENENIDVDLALSYIYYLDISSCISYDAPEASLNACGLYRPTAVITVYYTDTDGNESSFSLSVGAEAADGYYYTELSGNKQITVTAADSIDYAVSLLTGVSYEDSSQE